MQADAEVQSSLGTSMLSLESPASHMLPLQAASMQADAEVQSQLGQLQALVGSQAAVPREQVLPAFAHIGALHQAAETERASLAVQQDLLVAMLPLQGRALRGKAALQGTCGSALLLLVSGSVHQVLTAAPARQGLVAAKGALQGGRLHGALALLVCCRSQAEPCLMLRQHCRQ